MSVLKSLFLQTDKESNKEKEKEKKMGDLMNEAMHLLSDGPEIDDKQLDSMHLRIAEAPFMTADELLLGCQNIEQHPAHCGCKNAKLTPLEEYNTPVMVYGAPASQDPPTYSSSIEMLYAQRQQAEAEAESHEPDTPPATDEKKSKDEPELNLDDPNSTDGGPDIDLRELDLLMPVKVPLATKRRPDHKPDDLQLVPFGVETPAPVVEDDGPMSFFTNWNRRRKENANRWLDGIPVSEEKESLTALDPDASLSAALEKTYNADPDGRMPHEIRKNAERVHSRDLIYVTVTLFVAMGIIMAYVFISEAHKKNSVDWTPDSRLYANTLGYFIQGLPAIFSLHFTANLTGGESYSGRVLVNAGVFSYDYQYNVMDGEVIARETYDGIQKILLLTYYKWRDNLTLSYQPISWQHLPIPNLPTWSELLMLPVVSHTSLQTGADMVVEIQAFGVNYELCMTTAAGPSFVRNPSILVRFGSFAAITSANQAYYAIVLPAAPTVPYNSGSFPVQFPSTGRDLSSFLQLQELYVHRKPVLPDLSWTSWSILDQLLPVSRASDQMAAQLHESVTTSNLSSSDLKWTYTKRPPAVQLTYGATCVFIPGIGSSLGQTSVSSSMHYAFGDSITWPQFANAGSYFGRNLSVNAVQDSNLGPCMYYEGQSLKVSQWIAPRYSGYYKYAKGTNEFTPCNVTDFGTRQQYGCRDTWTLNIPTVYLAPDSSTLVATVCQLINELWISQTPDNPVAIFSHSTGALTLLAGLNQKVCNSNMKWFALAPPFLGSPVNSWLSLVCNAVGSYNIWPIPGAAHLLQQWFGDCAHVVLGSVAAAHMTYPLTTTSAQLVRNHVSGVACGISPRGNSRQHGFIVSSLLIIFDKLGIIQKAAQSYSAQLGLCNAVNMPACDTYNVQTDGIIGVDSCQFANENRTWSSCFVDDFYVSSLNHLDLTCREGDSFMRSDQMPCSWILNRVRSLFNSTIDRRKCTI